MAASDAVQAILDSVGAGTPGSVAGDAVARLAESVVSATAVDGAAVIWMTDHGPGSLLSATDETAAVLEEIQFTLGEGPCVESSSLSRPVLVPDLDAVGPDRWPTYVAEALSAGIRAVFAIPLQVGGIRVGVVDLYRNTPGALTSHDLVAIFHHADAVTAVLLERQATSLDEQDGEPAAIPVDRAVVHQATGMVSVQMTVDLATALVILRAKAFASGRPLAEIAVEVIESRLRFDPVFDR